MITEPIKRPPPKPVSPLWGVVPALFALLGVFLLGGFSSARPDTEPRDTPRVTEDTRLSLQNQQAAGTFMLTVTATPPDDAAPVSKRLPSTWVGRGESVDLQLGKRFPAGTLFTISGQVETSGTTTTLIPVEVPLGATRSSVAVVYGPGTEGVPPALRGKSVRDL